MGSKITFFFMDCTLCHKVIEHVSLRADLAPMIELYAQILSKAIERMRIDGLDKDARLQDKDGPYFKNPEKFAMHSYAFYTCFKCKKPYFGGRRDCEQNRAADESKLEDMICFDCSDMRVMACAVAAHREFVAWKCRFCCSDAVWFCFGTTHFCNPCHDKWIKSQLSRDTKPANVPQCRGKAFCPLKIDHPPNGGTEEFSLGCGLCTEKKAAGAGMAPAALAIAAAASAGPAPAAAAGGQPPAARPAAPGAAPAAINPFAQLGLALDAFHRALAPPAAAPPAAPVAFAVVPPAAAVRVVPGAGRPPPRPPVVVIDLLDDD